MDEPVTVDDAPDAVEMSGISGEVTFEDVTFSYEEGINVLEHMDLHVKAGESIALVGPTGAGKSTIINLLCRFYNLNGGRILLKCKDGSEQDISKVTLRSLRSQLGIMLQDSFIFSGNLLDNIRYGRLDATDEEVKEAARRVHVDELIRKMPMGYRTEIRERGNNLSQGERQLIAFARTLLSDPSILILDEATSSIDTRTESIVQKAMDALMHGRTTFVIAHRLSTVRNSDCIMVMEGGRIIERGNHDQLIAKKGRYYQLYTGKAPEETA
jgi:ATP-binding cassette subfamily B protein